MRLGSVNYETRGKVAILTLDEPGKLNALSAGIRTGILEGLKKADADDAIRVAIITGSGDKAFCAGADISGFDFDPEKARSFLIAALEVLAAPENTRKPVISAVNGIAYGGGFELAIASDSSSHPTVRGSRCRKSSLVCCRGLRSCGCKTWWAAPRPRK
jgi:enoyl-CoA hydratase/carnithine racemase